MTLPYREGATGRTEISFVPAMRKMLVFMFCAGPIAMLVMFFAVMGRQGVVSLDCNRDASNNGSCHSAFDGIFTHTDEHVPFDQIKRVILTTVSDKFISYRIDILKNDGTRVQFPCGEDLTAADKELADVNAVIKGHGEMHAGLYVTRPGALFYVFPIFALIGPLGAMIGIRKYYSRYDFALDRNTRKITVIQRVLGISFGAKEAPLEHVTAIALESEFRQGRMRSYYRILLAQNAHREPITPWLPEPKLANVAQQIADELNVKMIAPA
jgi:hypothetical protein